MLGSLNLVILSTKAVGHALEKKKKKKGYE